MQYQYQKEYRQQSRGKIIQALAQGRKTYSELREQTGLSDRTVSGILKELEDRKVVYRTNTEKKSHYYNLNETVISYIMQESLYVFDKMKELRNRFEIRVSDDLKPIPTVNGVSVVASVQHFFPVVATETIMEGELTSDKYLPAPPYFADTGSLEDSFTKIAHHKALDKSINEVARRVKDLAPKDASGKSFVPLADENLMNKLCAMTGQSITSVLIDYKAMGELIRVATEFYRSTMNGRTLSQFMPWRNVTMEDMELFGVNEEDFRKKGIPEREGSRDLAEIFFGYRFPQYLLTMWRFLKHIDSSNYPKNFYDFIVKAQEGIDGPYFEYLSSFSNANHEILMELKAAILYGVKDGVHPINVVMDHYGSLKARLMLPLCTGILIAISNAEHWENAEFIKTALEIYGHWPPQ
ncbi:MAG: winged helix-turn-helix domain-containing protein [Thermoplasmataceae archaeon]